MKLNLGCGYKPLEGYVNVDTDPDVKPDIVHNLEQLPWPFEDQSAEEIYMSHVLEHLGQAPPIFLGIMHEINRVLKIGGKLHLKVPHPRSDCFLHDPTHVRPVNASILKVFSKKYQQGMLDAGWATSPLARGRASCKSYDTDLELVSEKYYLTPYWLERMREDKIPDKEMMFYAETYYNVISELEIILERKS